MLAIVATCILFTPKASANIFPSDYTSPYGAPDDHLAVSAWQGDWHPATDSSGAYINGTGKYNCQYPSLFPKGQEAGACDTGLNGQSTFYELYTPNFGGAVPSTTITIDTGCLVDANTPYNKPDHPDKGNRQITVNIYQITPSGGRGALMSSSDNYNGGSTTRCDGNGNLIVNVPGTAFTSNESNRYAGDTLTALIGIYKDADVGNKTFRIETGGAVSVYGAPGDYFAEVDKYPPGAYVQVGPNDYASKDPTTYSFNFIPDCTFPGGKVTIGLDALSLGSSVQKSDIKLYLISPGQVQGTTFSYDNTVGWTTPVALQEGQPYKLYILNVNVDNGIKVKLPYGEYPAPPKQNCQLPSPVGGTPSCSKLDYGLQDHSNYRFTLFDRNGSYLSGTPVPVSDPDGNGTYASTTDYPRMGSWANFNASPAQQVGPPTTTNSTDNTKDITINYPDPTGPDRFVYVENWHHNSDGSWKYSYKTEDVSNCYSASCQITGIVGDPQKYDLVTGGGQFTATGIITNTGQAVLPQNFSSFSLGLTGMGGAHPVGFGLSAAGNPGDSRPFSITLTAPDQGNPYSYPVSLYPDYNGLVALGNTCTTTANVYAGFTLEPHAQVQLSPTSENPSAVWNTTYVKQTSGPPVNDPVTSTLNYTPYNGSQQPVGGGLSNNGPFNPGTTCFYKSPINVGDPAVNCTAAGPPGVYSPGSIQPGNKYCADITVPHASGGYVGPSGDLVGGTDGYAQDCKVIVNEPYFKVYNGSVSAAAVPVADTSSGICSGGGLAGGLVAGWHNNASGNYGAGSQLSALALLQITGFASAVNTAYVPGAALTFANAGNSYAGRVTKTSHLENPILGGLFDDPANNHCITGLSRGNPTTHNGVNSGTVGSAPLDKGEQSYGDGGLPVEFKLSGGQVTTPNNLTIYVTGDVYIKDNITLDTSGWSINGTNSTVPSFNLVVTDGNIYIDPNVTELDGIYEARPDSSGHKGTIYTCAAPASWTSPPFAQMQPGQLFGGCHNQLTVYGSFRGREVKLMRTFGSLRNDQIPGNYPASCSNTNAGGIPLENDSITALYPACAGEVFRFSPEIYLSTPALPPPNHGAPTWDAAASLPPSL